ncbi:hypothetical protein E3O46_18100 [Cryobacterium glucosi]|uniref:Uncharacterized protein n=2 Tax=Cryobacterium glucosi TaxID=1259175 RepID=A0ABY2IKE1_9MICO|nr:hypothetical protein E3O46_18100 [Cryobacterium glucosi]
MVENIPGGRLRGPWSGVREYDALWANWQRINDFDLTETEQDATERVFSLLIPIEVAQREWTPVRYATAVHEPAQLAKLIGLPMADLLAQIDSFTVGGVTMLSLEGTLLISEYACRIRPVPVLDWVISDESEYREKTKHGRNFVSSGNRAASSSPEWEYQWYLESVRPVHELLRAWCGHRAATMHERLAAAEAEVHRLDSLIVRLIDELKANDHSTVAEIIERTHEEERITPVSVRPIVDRPLKPSEIPVRYERAPRRWGH